MKYVAEAVELTISECLKQTKYERWDCKSVLKGPKFPSDLRDGKETLSSYNSQSVYKIVYIACSFM